VQNAKKEQPAGATRPRTTAPLVAEARASGSFQEAVPIRETRPETPPELRTLIQADNVVEVQVRISTSGKVTSARLAGVKGPAALSLSKTALNAALNWQFRPATQNGEAVPSDKILQFLFRPSSL
jgi:protein TonB